MRKAGALVFTAFFGLLANAALADDVPKLDFNKSCRTDVAAYPGGGLEFFAGPLGIRLEAGDEIYVNNKAYNNLRVTFGPTLRF